MDDLFFSFQIDHTKSLCISPLSSSLFFDSGVTNLGDDFGYFVYLAFADSAYADIRILAKTADVEGALMIADLAGKAMASAYQA